MNIATKSNIGRKIGATLIDYILFFAFFFWYLKSFGEYDSVDNTYAVYGFDTLPIIIFWAVYMILIENLTGATLGHHLFNLKVISFNGERTSFSQNLKRRLLDFIDILFWGIPALITIKNTEHHQRLGDLWAKTLVVQKDYVKFTSVYSGNRENWQKIINEIHCDKCNETSLGLENAIEFERNEKYFVTGYCPKCSNRIETEINI